MKALTARSPLAVASARELTLTDEVAWIGTDLVPGQRYRLRALVEGGPDTEDKAALVRFRSPLTGIGGSGIAVSRKVGGHIYLRTGNDLHRTDRVFSVGTRVPAVGLMAWGGRGPVRVRTLVVERLEPAAQPSDIFLSFDVDFLDPAYAPGTGTPEVGGFSTAEALGFLRALRGITLAGADVVEVAPSYDGPGQATSVAAANVAWELLGLRATSRLPTSSD